MPKYKNIVSLTLATALLLASPLLPAEPKNKDKDNKGGQGQKSSQQQPKQQSVETSLTDTLYKAVTGGSFTVDNDAVRTVLADNPSYWVPAKPLPPGMQKKLAKGQPLPPGIAKKLDNRLVQQLPQYQGYEWQQVGTDLVLVALSSGVVEDVLTNLFH